MRRIEPPDSKAQPLLRVIVEAIDSGRVRPGEPNTFLSSSEALSRMGIEWSGSAGRHLRLNGLDELAAWTRKHEALPKIAALIVNKSTRRPPRSFIESHGHGDDRPWEHRWLDEASRAIAFDWKPFLRPIVRASPQALPPTESRVREASEDAADRDILTAMERGQRGGTLGLRGSRIGVGDILGWLAAGTSEAQIVREHPELTVTDIRAALASAAEREKGLAPPAFAQRWRGKFKLPASDPADARLSYLLKRYHRSDA